jgi:hypothetical protein
MSPHTAASSHLQEHPLSNDIQQYASISGELAPNLWGRADFQKYDSAWAEARNWLVDYRGGLFTRPGTEFGDIIQWAAGQSVKLVEFQYSPDTANTYVLVFTNYQIRLIQDNAYVLEAAKTVTSFTNDVGNRVLVTAASHGYENGDWIKFAGQAGTDSYKVFVRTFQVANKTANTFNLVDVISYASVDMAAVSIATPGSAYRIYTIPSYYGSQHLSEVRCTQVRDYLRMCHPDFPVYNLIRAGATSWSIAAESFGESIGTVSGISATSSNADGEAFVYRVTAINDEGEEGLPDIHIETNAADILNTNGKWISVVWNAVSTAVYYNVYRSRSIDSADRIYPDQECGFIGQSVGTVFTDDGITADFDVQSPISYNPFANGSIRYVTISVAGTTYDHTVTPTIVWPTGGSGAYGYVVANDGASSGAVRGIMIVDGGADYTGTSVTITGGSGTFAGVATLTAATGNNPHCAAIFQQRMVYGATDNNPLRLFGSRPGQLSNFNYTQIGADDDSYEFDIDAPKVAPIRHIVPMRGGLLVFNQIGCWLVYGNNDEALTSFNAKIDFQNSVGASLIAPVYVDNYVVYISEVGQEARMLAYDDNSRVYMGRNLSLLSNHLFSSDKPIISMSFAESPFKILYMVRSDGTMVALTIDNDNGVYGATPLTTNGYFTEVLSVDEDQESRVYVAVQREVNNYRVMYLERFARRNNIERLEDAVCLDCSVNNFFATEPAAYLTVSSVTGAVTVTATGAVFFVEYIGYILYCGTGKILLSGYTSATVMTGTWIRDLEDTFPERTDPAEFQAGTWSLNGVVENAVGTWHLEGETVSALLDGEVVTGLSATSQYTEFTGTASKVCVGLPYTCRARTLPLTASDTPIEGRKKSIKGIALRMYRSIGLKIGPSMDKLREVAIRAQRLGWTSTDALQTDIINEPVRMDWKRDAQVYVVQDSPRPAAILNFIRDVDLGDDKE